MAAVNIANRRAQKNFLIKDYMIKGYIAKKPGNYHH